ncbi:MAG: stage 0 sporulation protein [Dictyoglomus sp. NZ13-RE01]|nr:MAG: stage 0 sporulation protein [Dictyoglomus sp. NZ13-RE01]
MKEPLYIVGVRLRSFKVYYFSTKKADLKPGDWVIVKTVQGTEAGTVAIPPFIPPDNFEPVTPLKPILRKANEEDLEKIKRYREEEKEGVILAQKKAEELGLPIKILACEIAFNYSKITFHFASEERVDFRELVKELANHYKTRIELHQVGVRDEVRYLGAIGICGREVCCHSFLPEFNSISVKMAKEQSLVLNPIKISGVCGRLMCCLAYEYDVYQEIKASLPPKGAVVQTPQGEGVIVDHHIPLNKVIVEFEEGGREFFSPNEVKVIQVKNENGHKHEKIIEKIFDILEDKED